MKNSFKQFNEIIDSLYVILKEPCGMPLLEKDILLSRVRELYVAMQTIAVEENKVQQVEKQQPQQADYTVFQGIDDDVDLFFDTEHDSYTQSIPAPSDEMEPEEELEEDPAPKPEEIPVEEVVKPVETQKVAIPEKEEEAKGIEVELAPEAPQMEEAQEPEPQKEQPEPAHQPTVEPTVDRSNAKSDPIPELDFGADQDDVAELFSQSYRPETPQAPAKPDEVITPEPLMVDDEDDLLQFVPQRFEPKKAEQPTSRPEQTAKPRSLNDLFMERKEDRSLGFQYQHAKVGDLTKAISINEKFTFIKELFNNRGEEFSAAIQQLNQCTNREEAFDKLETLKKKYFWDSASTAYLSLCDLLRRKFM